MKAINIAQICHEANRTYCTLLGDTSQVAWEDAPQWQKDSALKGVEGILSGEIMYPEQSHESWLAVKEAEGWTYGEVKDVEKKQHPCFRPYAELPEEQKTKDAIFFNIVSAFIEEPRLTEGFDGVENSAAV